MAISYCKHMVTAFFFYWKGACEFSESRENGVIASKIKAWKAYPLSRCSIYADPRMNMACKTITCSGIGTLTVMHKRKRTQIIVRSVNGEPCFMIEFQGKNIMVAFHQIYCRNCKVISPPEKIFMFAVVAAVKQVANKNKTRGIEASYAF